METTTLNAPILFAITNLTFEEFKAACISAGIKQITDRFPVKFGDPINGDASSIIDLNEKWGAGCFENWKEVFTEKFGDGKLSITEDGVEILNYKYKSWKRGYVERMLKAAY